MLSELGAICVKDNKESMMLLNHWSGSVSIAAHHIKLVYNRPNSIDDANTLTGERCAAGDS